MKKKNMTKTKPEKAKKTKTKHSRPVSYAFRDSKHAQPLGILKFPR